MRKYIFSPIFVFMMQPAFAQMPHWTSVQIPVDSLNPVCLKFVDSLHGYFGALRARNHGIIWDDHQMFWFTTTDGGKNWKRLIHAISESQVFTDSTRGLVFNINDHFSPMFYPSVSQQYLWGWNKSSNAFLTRTTDGGNFWQKEDSLFSPNAALVPCAVFSENHLLAFSRLDKGLSTSSDYGKTFTALTLDSVYHNIANPFYPLDTDGYDTPSFDYSDSNTWTIAWSYAEEIHRGIMPRGLHTLLSTNAGVSWESHTTPISGDTSNSYIEGTLQYIKGTSDLYYFIGPSESSGVRSANTNSLSNYSAALFGISYLYSNDNGRTWTPQNMYGNKRRAYHVVQKNEVWITASTDTMRFNVGGAPAYKICRTKDNGIIWEEDTSTLTMGTQKLDGRIMTFSDPHHGWIAASNWPKTFIYRYNENEVINTVANAANNGSHLKIYPNPASTELTLELPREASTVHLEIYDMLGNKRLVKDMTNASIFTIDVHDFSTGCYLARISFLGGNYSKMFIVQH